MVLQEFSILIFCMTFTRNSYIKIAGVFVFVVIITFVLRFQVNRNVSFIETFYNRDINGVIKNVRQGSGGFHTLETTDGYSYTFCCPGGSFEREVKPGDSISKPALHDTIRIYNREKDLKFTFLKP